MKEFVFAAMPWGHEITAVADTQNQAHRMVWESMPDFYKNNLECLDCVDEYTALPEQTPGISSTQLRHPA